MTEQSYIYELKDLPRNLGFPLPLDQVGWMIRHKNPLWVLNATFVCISYNRKQYSPDAPADAIFSVHYPGTTIPSAGFLHDEIFFAYDSELAPRICELFKGTSFFRQPFVFTPEIAAQCAGLHERLKHIHEAGMADNLDFLALQLINSCIQAIHNYTAPVSCDDNMRIYEIAAGLKRGECLDKLIRKHNLGRRKFYYVWNRLFNVSPNQYRQEEMLKQAQLLLQHTTMPVAEVAYNCGFSNETCLFRLFKQKFNMTPTQYRKQERMLL